MRVLLRVLEYYEGILVLTTNRIRTLDKMCSPESTLLSHTKTPMTTRRKISILTLSISSQTTLLRTSCSSEIGSTRKIIAMHHRSGGPTAARSATCSSQRRRWHRARVTAGSSLIISKRSRERRRSFRKTSTT